MKFLLFVLLVQLMVLATQGEKRQKRAIRWTRLTKPVVFWPSDSNSLAMPDVMVFDKTATETYDPVNEICCQGKAFPNPRRSNQGCCAGNAYDLDKQLCCNGVIRDKTQGSKCCGQEVYNVNNAVCCNNKVNPVTATELDSVQCCGQEKYEPSKSLCCGALLGTAKVVDKTSERHFCCGDRAINEDTQICCLDVLYQKEEVRLLNIHVVPRDENRKKNVCCVGGKIFDPTTQTCCGTELVDGANRTCCGNVSVDRANQLCCRDKDGNKVAVAGKESAGDQCCDSKAGNPEKQLCCMGNMFDKTDTSLHCCGEDSYSSNNAFCISTTSGNQTSFARIQKKNSNQDGVCGRTPFNRASQACCPTSSGELAIIPVPTDVNTMCCGDQTYKWGTAICCQDDTTKQYKLHEGINFVSGCCGLEKYDMFTQICCGGKIYPKGDTTACCGQTYIYDTNTDVCCSYSDPQQDGGGEIFGVAPRKSATTSCCGLTSYDSTNEICCNGKSYPYDRNSVCCGDRVANVLKELCCGGNIVPKKDIRSTSCCYYGLG